MAIVRFKVEHYMLELGVRNNAINNDRANVPFHQLLLKGTVNGAEIRVVMEFWLGIELMTSSGPAEVGQYSLVQKRAVIKARFIDFLNTYEVVRSEKPVFCTFTHTDSGPPHVILSSAISTQEEPVGEGPTD